MAELIAGMLGIAVGFIVLVVLFVVVIYNKLVNLRNTAQSSWSDIDVHLKKRYDLVPNLVETVKGYAAHEKSVFEKVSEASSMAARTSSPVEKTRTEDMLSDTLKNLFAVAEAYPELKANTPFIQLQSRLKELEDHIESARGYYNAVVRDLNTLIQSFPSNVIASSFKFQKEEFFGLETPDVERKPAKASFS